MRKIKIIKTIKIIYGLVFFVVKKTYKKIRLNIKTFLNSFNKLHQLIYVVDDANWSIYHDGESVTKNLHKIKAKIDTTGRGYKNKIIHIGCFPMFFAMKNDELLIKKIAQKNKIILTIFHIGPSQEKLLSILKENIDLLEKIHTSCQSTKEILLKIGISKEKIVVIPLGVDLKRFTPKIQKDFSNKDEILIASFQKDGAGWREGLEPKLIKGPDIFCDALEQLSKKYKIKAILTGPSRGYVKNRLKKASIPFEHKYFEDYYDVVGSYHKANIYLITSRVEGGPKAILESWATGTPLVSTRVGLVPDIIKGGINGIMVEIEDIEKIVESVGEIIENKELRNSMTKQGLEDIKDFDWKKIANRYYNEIYKNLL